MPVRCKICLYRFTSKELLVQHHRKSHSKAVRCTLCFLRFHSRKMLNIHYVKRHSKQQLSRKLINLTSKCSVRPFNYVKIKKEPNSSKEHCKSSSEIEKIYVKENILISYGNKEIIMELSSDNEESLELTIDDVSSKLENEEQVSLKTFMYDKNSNCTFEEVKLNEKLVIFPSNRKKKNGRTLGKKRKPVKRYKHFCLEFVKPNGRKYLDHKTGQFHICNCDKDDYESKKGEEIVTVTSDTESSSDNGKYSFYPIIDKKFYCTICGNGYRTKSKLLEHRKIHNYHCQTCDNFYTTQKQFTDHLKNHVFVFCCHICHHEFLQKLALLNHLKLHQEQDMLKTVLDLEQNYSHYLINFKLDSYAASINNITSFLTQTGEYNYSPNHFYKIKCHLCYLDFFKSDFEEHLKMHFYFKNLNPYMTRPFQNPKV